MRIISLKSLLTVLTAACLVPTFLTGCSGNNSAETAAPSVVSTESTDSVTVSTAANAASLAQQEDEGSLLAWELDAEVWSSSNGATITVKAQPRNYEKGQAASFVVRLDDAEVENRSCQWDGTTYTAQVDLEAANGYDYEFVLFPPQGASEHFSMSGAYDSLVNLEASLTAYCNLYISDYLIENDVFSVTAGYATVQLPQLVPAGNTVSYQSARLIFELNGEEIASQNIDLPEGEGIRSHEAALSGIQFSMPEMENDYQLDLVLEVSLSTGETLTCNGGSWYFSNGEPQMSAG